jgi:ureidoacrylate peracid hydrolase
MMLDYKVVLLSDCTAALSDDEQRTTLENMIQQFGDVLTSSEAIALLDANDRLRPARSSGA